MRTAVIALCAALTVAGAPAAAQGPDVTHMDRAKEAPAGREAFDAGGASLAVNAVLSTPASHSARELLAIYLLVSAQAKKANSG